MSGRDGTTRVGESAPSRSATGPSAADRARYATRGAEVIRAEIRGLETAIAHLEYGFADAADLLSRAEGRVFAVGVGKSGLIARKFAATLTSTGTSAVFVHPVDALHGDLGVIGGGDVVVMFSKSGATEELSRLVPLLRRFRVPVILLTSDPEPALGGEVDVVVTVGRAPEAASIDLVPTTSTTATLAVSDALAVIVMEARGFTREDFAFLHPGGVIGHLSSKRVRDVMHGGADLPRVRSDATLRDALVEIVRARLGMTTVVDAAGALVGVVADGDMKRVLLREDAGGEGDVLLSPVGEIMTRSPITIEPDARLVSALAAMENNPGGAITSLVVIDDGRPIGVVHIHDCVRP